MGRKSIRPRNLDDMWNSLLQESRKLGLKIILDREIFFANFEILNDRRRGDYFYTFLMDQLTKLKKSLNESKELPSCPKCQNVLLITGYVTSDEDNVFYYSCTSCGSSFQFEGYGFTDTPKKNQLKEISHPIFEAMHFCGG